MSKEKKGRYFRRSAEEKQDEETKQEAEQDAEGHGRYSRSADGDDEPGSGERHEKDGRSWYRHEDGGGRDKAGRNWS